MSEETSSFESCVAAKMADGMTKEEAEAACKQKDTETAEKAAFDAIRSNDQKAFSGALDTLVKISMGNFKELIVKEGLKAVLEAKEEYAKMMVDSIKKSIVPQKPQFITKQGLVQALREIKLEEAGQGKKSEIEGHVKRGEYTEPPTSMPDIHKRVSTDLDKMIDQFSSTKPEGAE